MTTERQTANDREKQLATILLLTCRDAITGDAPMTVEEMFNALGLAMGALLMTEGFDDPQTFMIEFSKAVLMAREDMKR